MPTGDDFIHHVRTALHGPCAVMPGAVVIAAVSGGADSVALLAALSQLDLRVTAAHVNYGLRGDESDSDEEFVRSLCASLGVELRVLRADVPARMRATGASLEMACRDIRYEWFEALRSELHADAVVVAHHRDDRVETFLLNVLRGSGIAGLRGMEPRRQPGVVRPMLGLARDDVEAFLRECGLSWRVDSSNAVADVKRNKVRLRVIPALREAMGDDAPQRIIHTMDCLAEEEGLLRHLVDNERRAVTLPDGSLDVGALCRRHGPEAAPLLYQMLRCEGVTRSMADDITAGPMRPSATFGPFTLSRGVLALAVDEPPLSRALSTLADGPWNVAELTRADFHPTRDANVAWFDADAIPADAHWMLRTRHNGDRMRPFAMRGTRLLSDIYADAKLSPRARACQPVLTCNGVIAWLPGLANAHFAPVTPSTTRIIRLTYRPVTPSPPPPQSR